jgi:hypothetical protein
MLREGIKPTIPMLEPSETVNLHVLEGAVTAISSSYNVIMLITVKHCPRRGSWSLEHLDPGFEFHSRHGYLSSSFCVVLSCVGRDLATGRSPVQRVLPNVGKFPKFGKNISLKSQCSEWAMKPKTHISSWSVKKNAGNRFVQSGNVSV